LGADKKSMLGETLVYIREKLCILKTKLSLL